MSPRERTLKVATLASSPIWTIWCHWAEKIKSLGKPPTGRRDVHPWASWLRKHLVRLAAPICIAVGTLYRQLGLANAGSLPGRLLLSLSPTVLRTLSATAATVVISGTNGKTTTTRLIAEVLSSHGSVATNSSGANMPAGIATALAVGGSSSFAALEVDERYLPEVCEQISPDVVVLLNLSRDQLDRNPESFDIATRWRRTLAGRTCTVVANCDDPMVYWAASIASHVVWVRSEDEWSADSWYCPSCGSCLEREMGHWSCRECYLESPQPHWRLRQETIYSLASGEEYKLSIALPGRINYVNSAMALAAVSAMGISPHEAVERFKQVRSVAGRYRVLDIYGCQVRILLAKNPASWARTMQLLQEGGAFESRSLLLILNARAIDGLDPSWIWDVDFSGFDGATLFVTGERALDMALRLDVAGLPFHIVASVREACARAPGGHLEIVANYSGFVDLIKECQRLNVW